ncbi:PQQ-binding-like beta-propeller repeat protein [Streptomyces sp. NRRL F-5123]|uniref:outer membrane protein assembly factor BamB family protein n=1 Tax=Streptomyces sp. NRRL F-5123 TaxID=1463856 RepID=UPI0004E210A3|nr:PQQ-binding-like beta-propeller repeat protein [Streptomyces sp. NRRL F-5123]
MAGNRGRTAVAGVVAVVVAAGGWLWARQGDDHHETVTTAAGAYPAAFGSAPPDVPGRAVRRTADSYGVTGALSVDEIADRDLHHDGVEAHDLHTGRSYWRYTRTGADLDRVALAGTGDTVALWWDDGLITALDVRTGKPRWRHTLTYGDLPGDNGGIADLRMTGDLVVAQRRDDLTAFDAATGRKRWTAETPEGCGQTYGMVRLMAKTVVTEGMCGRTGEPQVFGFDENSGALRWKLEQKFKSLRPADDHTLITSLWTHEGTAATVDISGAKPAVTTFPVRPDQPAVGGGDGVLLCSDNRTQNDEHEGALVAFGIGDHRQRWTAGPAEGLRFGSPLLVGNRVYVVQQPSRVDLDDDLKPLLDGYDARLVVLDAGTGRQLSSTPLPLPAKDTTHLDVGPDAQLAPQQATGGVVTVAWVGLTGTDVVNDLSVMGQ